MCRTSYRRNKLQEVVTINNTEMVFKLRKEGKTCKEIGNTLGISRQWVSYLLNHTDEHEKPHVVIQRKARPRMSEFDMAQYKREHIDRVAFEVPKGKRNVLDAKAKELGISRNNMITYALEKQYNLDISKE